jgi:hypothetical protein
MIEKVTQADEARSGAALTQPERACEKAGRRLAREARTMQAMVACYCRAHHAPAAAVCPECQALLDYAMRRLDRCQFGTAKPTCAKCPVHCYQRHWRDQIKSVMRYAGARMLWRHPILSLRHWLDSINSPQPQSPGHQMWPPPSARAER